MFTENKIEIFSVCLNMLQIKLLCNTPLASMSQQHCVLAISDGPLFKVTSY